MVVCWCFLGTRHPKTPPWCRGGPRCHNAPTKQPHANSARNAISQAHRPCASQRRTAATSTARLPPSPPSLPPPFPLRPSCCSSTATVSVRVGAHVTHHHHVRDGFPPSCGASISRSAPPSEAPLGTPPPPPAAPSAAGAPGSTRRPATSAVYFSASCGRRRARRRTARRRRRHRAPSPRARPPTRRSSFTPPATRRRRRAVPPAARRATARRRSRPRRAPPRAAGRRGPLEQPTRAAADCERRRGWHAARGRHGA